LKPRRFKERKSADPPPAVSRQGWKYHHLGIPTDIPRSGERYLEHLKIYVSGFETSPYGIEWMRFDPDCGIPELVRTVPHIAFEVDDLEAALEGQEVLSPPGSPSKGVRAAMILADGAPVELIEFRPGRRSPGPRRASGKSGRKGRGAAVRRRGSRR
jgi:hypothetical protein